MNLNQNKDPNHIPTYDETRRDKLFNKVAFVTVVGSLIAAVVAAPNIDPAKAKTPSHLGGLSPVHHYSPNPNR